MTPAPSLADHYRAVAEVTHEDRKRAEAAEAELAEERKLSASLALDNRALKDRLAERDQTIARLGREQADSGTLISRLRDTATQPTPLRAGERLHLGLGGCWCGVTHSHGQAVAMNAGLGRDRTEASA